MMIKSTFLVLMAFALGWGLPRKYDETLDEFNEEFHILVEPGEEAEAEAKRLKEVEAQINEQNEKFAKGEASSGAKLYPFSDLSKEEMKKEKTGLVIPSAELQTRDIVIE